ncbi:hypothetical protein [Flavihumibacter solisilvae]|nr:hypothetical protein [Flavihumibacter solisilvae]
MPQVRISYFLLVCLSVILVLNGHRAHAQNRQKITRIQFRPENAKAGDVIPFYYKGEYHIFYMRNSSWGHIVSKDLVNWNELPDALAKGIDSLAPDGEGCWTGSIVENKGMFYLFYTGKNAADPKGDQKVMLATSKDLVQWTKEPSHTFYADGNIYWNKTINGKIDDKLIYHHQAFRDPDVFWNKEKNEWWMILHATVADQSFPATGLYISKDLINWRPSKPLVVYPVNTNVSGDCPFVFQSNGKWFLNFADYHYKTANRAEGPYDDQPREFDCGDLRVPKVMWDGRRNILMGWIADYEDNVDSGRISWGGTLCMPRELWTDSSGNEFQRPVKEVIESFRSLAIQRPQNFIREHVLKIPADYMFHAQLVAKTTDTKLVIRFPQTSRNDESDYHLKIDFTTKEIEMGSRYKSYKRVCDFDPRQAMDIRIFRLGDVLECFINDAWAFTMRAYKRESGKLTLIATEGTFKILRGEISEPRSAYSETISK